MKLQTGPDMTVIHIYHDQLKSLIIGKATNDGVQSSIEWVAYPVLLRRLEGLDESIHESQWVAPIPIYDTISSGEKLSLTRGILEIEASFGACNLVEWEMSVPPCQQKYHKVIRQLQSENGQVLAYWTMSGSEIEIGILSNDNPKQYRLQKSITPKQKTTTAYDTSDRSQTIQLYRLDTMTELF